MAVDVANSLRRLERRLPPRHGPTRANLGWGTGNLWKVAWARPRRPGACWEGQVKVRSWMLVGLCGCVTSACPGGGSSSGGSSASSTSSGSVSSGPRALGEPCVQPTDCLQVDAGAACADERRACRVDGGTNCVRTCLRLCRSHTECPPDQICWPTPGGAGVCQVGECGERNQTACPPGEQCMWFKSGRTGGKCFAPCDVDRQVDCRNSPPPADARCCGPQQACVHFASNSASTFCEREGRASVNENCDTEEADGLPSCKAGLFCSDLLGCPVGGNCHGTCVEYCRRLASSGPRCSNPGSVCVALSGGESLPWGYCQ